MPLTRSQMAEMSELRDQATSDWSGDESNCEGRVASVQEEANGGQLSELRKIQLTQEHEYRMKQMEIEKEKMEREAERERIELEKERERMAFEIRKLELMNQNNNNNRDSGTEPSQLSKSDLKKFPTYKQGHADIFSAHMGINKTKQRIAQNFYWPDMGKHIKCVCV